MSSELRIIYIAGYGRSGSTLLERILASHASIWGTGELASLPYVIDDERTLCSCGQPIRACEFWGKVIAKLEDQSRQRWRRTQGMIESPFGVCLLLKQNGVALAYKEITHAVMRAVWEELPSGVRYIVDSSKTARRRWLRPLSLARHAGIPIKVIHLVRDGRGCLWSQLRGSNRKMEMGEPAQQRLPALRTALSWPLANLGAHLFQLFFPHDYFRVRYEDLVSNPASTLKSIGTFLGVNLDQQIKMLLMHQDIPLGHQVAGNRLRMERKIVLRVDNEWQAKLRRWHRLILWMICWPFELLYGYRPGRRGGATA